MNHVSDLKAFSSNSFIKGNYREIWSHTQVSPVFLLPKDVTTEFKSYHQRKQSSLRAREWRSKHSQDWIEAFEWLICMHWTIYIHLRLHMVAFVLICANDSIWENSKGTLRYSHPPLLMGITLAVFSYGHCAAIFIPHHVQLWGTFTFYSSVE